MKTLFLIYLNYGFYKYLNEVEELNFLLISHNLCNSCNPCSNQERVQIITSCGLVRTRVA